MGKAKIISPQEAAALLRDGDTFTTSGFVASGIPETLNKAVERRFLETGHPRDLTYVYASSQGNRDGRGGEHYAHKGLLKRFIAGHWATVPALAAMAMRNELEGYNLAQGALCHLFRDIAAHKPGVTEAAEAVVARLKAAGIRVKGDFSDNSPGWKFAEWEMKGVPVRLELGPRDIENGQCVCARRDSGEKVTLPLENLEESIPALLEAVQQGLFDKAKRNLDEHTYTASTVDEVKDVIENRGGGFVETMWCGDEACELKMKELAGVTSRCIPFDQKHVGDVCPVCGKPAQKMIVWGVAY